MGKKYFSRLDVQNVQSIADVSLELGAITLIVGPSNLGKSAIYRALDILVHNNFRSHRQRRNTNNMRIALYKETGEYAAYIRNGKTQYYNLNGVDFTKIGKNQPKEIQDFFGMAPIQFDTDLQLDFNFQQQKSSPFLISLSGFELGKVFGKLINLELLMYATKEVSKDEMGTKDKVAKQEVLIKSAEDFILENSIIETKYFLSKRLKALYSEYKEVNSRYQKLKDLICKIEQTKSTINESERVLSIQTIQSVENFDFSRANQLKYLIFSVEKCLYNRDFYSRFDFSFLDTFASKDTLYSSLYSLLLKLYQSKDTSTRVASILAEFPNISFSMDNYPRLRELLIKLYLENHKISFVKQQEIPDFEVKDFSNVVAAINTYKQGLKNVDTAEQMFNSSVEDYNNCQLEYQAFIEKEGLCPITNKPFTDYCKSLLKEAI